MPVTDAVPQGRGPELLAGAAHALSAGGALSRTIEGFSPRPQQQEMAEAVAAVLESAGTLVCEAGTGTGKTFAYLVPALLSGARVIVSTGTKNLQDQLFHRDLPVVRRALAVPATVALLKGRANYLCLQRLEEAGGATVRGRAPAALKQLSAVAAWAGRTRTGDIAELAGVPEDSSVWPLVTSTTDNCLGQECPLFDRCFVVRARREAIAADLVVVNHHLFLADMALKEEGFGELLPSADAVIFDEAHQLPETALQFFGISVSSRQVAELARDATLAGVSEAGDVGELQDLARALETDVRELRLSLGQDSRRAAWQQGFGHPPAAQSFARLVERINDLGEVLAAVAERGQRLENCLRRSRTLAERLGRFDQAEEQGEAAIRWWETYTRSFVLHRTPLSVAETFRARMDAYHCAWAFTSATLAIGEDFTHFCSSLGLIDAVTRRWDSPYDFAHQALAYFPFIDSDPRAAGYMRSVVEAVVPVLEASRGRAFVLCTSHRALRQAAELLSSRIGFPLLVQGDAPRDELLERFRQTSGAVLLGTTSFWEGVDVRGEQLSCVVIDKLPFASPDDPMLQARLEALRAEGRNGFMEYQVPQAVVMLKQGVGRLIRDAGDRGVLVLCDPRVLAKPYGRVFLNELPPMRRTRRLEDVQAFFAGEGTDADPERAPAHG